MCDLFDDEVLSLFADGRLSREERTRVEAHLEVCCHCRAKLNSLLTSRRVFVGLPEHTPLLTFDEVLRVYERKRRVGRLTRTVAVLTAAACLLLVTFLFLPLKTESPPSSVAPPQRTPITKKPVSEPLRTTGQQPFKKPRPKLVDDSSTNRAPQHQEREVKEQPKGKHPSTVEKPPTEQPSPFSESSSSFVQQTPIMFEDVVARFKEANKTKSLKTQAEAVRTMGQIGTPQAETFLCRLALDRDQKLPLRVEATLALGEIGTKKAVETILRVGTEGREELRKVAVEALGRVKILTTLEWLLSNISRSKEKEKKLLVAHSLCHIKNLPLRKLFYWMKRERDEVLKLKVVEMMVKRGDNAALQVLCELAKDRFAIVRRMAVESLGTYGVRGVRSLVEIARNSRDPFIRQQAIRALLSTRTKEGALAVLPFLRDQDRRIHGTVLKGLIDITGRVFRRESAWRRYLRGLKTFPPIRENGEVAYPADFTIWDIPFWTRSVVFVIDSSSVSHRIGAFEEAVEVVKNAVKGMAEHIRVNIVCYSGNLLTYTHKKLVPVRTVRDGLIRFLNAQTTSRLHGAKLYDALITAIKLAPDDIVLLTTGAITKGRFKNIKSLVQAVIKANKKCSRIHVLAFFSTTRKDTERLTPLGSMVDALRMLAEVNMGEFRYKWIRLSK